MNESALEPQSNCEHEVHDVYPSRVYSKPKILPRLDPVVYSAKSVSGPLTSGQLEFYEKNGYLFIENFFAEKEIEIYRKELRRLAEEGKSSGKPEVIIEPESEEVRSVFAVHRDCETFAQLACDRRLVGIAKQILGSDVYIHQSRINFKPGFKGKEFYWHSDFETWHVEDGMPRMRAFSVSIALEDNYIFNGPLMVLPGSHKEFISCVGRTPDNHYKQSLKRQEFGVPDNENMKQWVKKYGIQIPTGKKGSILIFDCNIMHGSNSNITPFPRSNVFLVYNSVENRIVAPFSGQKPRPEYISHREYQPVL
jgi:ectoine hydroxylase